MRISELAERTGVSVATVKYYLREGLLPPGEATAATQARYSDEHVHRLQLIRVLREVGDVPVADLAEVLAAVGDRSLDLQSVLRTAHHALGPRRSEDSPESAATRAEIVRYLKDRRWEVDRRAPSIDRLATTLVYLRRLGWPVDASVFDRYADAADSIAREELATIDASRGRAAAVEQIVVGTVVFEQALVALRRLAEEHHSSLRFSRRSRRSG
ncbi:MAG TPA: MerR family transcriptional regulator [Acidimicrobiales bacterium]